VYSTIMQGHALTISVGHTALRKLATKFGGELGVDVSFMVLQILASCVGLAAPRKYTIESFRVT
jgi:hypothetical protein